MVLEGDAELELTARPEAVVAVTAKLLVTTLPTVLAFTALSLTDTLEALVEAPTRPVMTSMSPTVFDWMVVVPSI